MSTSMAESMKVDLGRSRSQIQGSVQVLVDLEQLWTRSFELLMIKRDVR